MRHSVCFPVTILEGVDIPEAVMIKDYLLLQKRVAMVSSWIDAVESDGRVHGYVNPIGAQTNRMSHSSPNVAQVPAGYSPYGKDCRECWIVPKGYKLVGMDASGLELRMLAHYMNDEEYTNQILDGDIHTYNQNMAGLKSRDIPEAVMIKDYLLLQKRVAMVSSWIDAVESDGRVSG